MTADFNAPVVSHLLEEDANELYENAPCGYLSTLPDGTIIKANTTFQTWTGYGRNFLLDRKRFQDLLPVVGRVFYDTHFNPLLLMQGYVKELAFEIICQDGQRIPILLNSVLKRDAAGAPLVIRTTLLDARGRRTYEEELRLAKRKAEDAEATLKKLNESLEELVSARTHERDRIWKMSQDMLVVASLNGYLVNFNPAFSQILGWDFEEVKTLPFVNLVHPDHLPELEALLASLAEGQPASHFETRNLHKDGTYRWVTWTVMPEGELLYAVGRDCTEEKSKAEILRKTEEALRQSQKMEAIGKLTGGVAHDFNNILQVIAGNLELLKQDFAGNALADQRLKVAVNAVGRGANLASQLLSFARRQPLQPVPTNLGRILREMDDLLRRALGESIEIETIVGGGLWTAMVDRNQLENVILNLAINARDAMKGGGKLTLELGNAMLDDHYAQIHPEVIPGQYVMLGISDTGSGMPPHIMERVFEPFFTTKPEGEGTGLGLSMVYGFVKQSGGHIKIYSEVGSGTTFKIYLPRVYQEEAFIPDVRKKPAVGGTETILVVEDDLDVQATVVETLSSLGYRVLRAKDGQSALSILQSGVAIDLLFTDVVMPGPVRSTELARQAKELLPDLAVLFTSGYTQNAIVHGGRLDPGVELISKPYPREDLARKIRHLLANREQELQARSWSVSSPPHAATSSAMKPHRILVVEDNVDSQQMLCELLNLLGYAAQGVSSAEAAINMLALNSFDVLLTDVSLPGMSGVELAKKTLHTHPGMKIIFSSGFGHIQNHEFKSFSLPKPYTLQHVQEVLAQIS